VIEDGRIKEGHSHQTITSDVIAAPRNLSDIRPVAVNDCLRAYISQKNHMSNYLIHTIASAPEHSKSALEQLQQAFGVVPNLAAAIANSPKLIATH
jgi:hypothetical protein